MLSGIFCPDCGTIFDLPETDSLRCSSCLYTCNYTDLKSLTSVTCSEPKPVPSWLQDSSKSMDLEINKPSRATVEETCPKCSNTEMEFYTMQLRSADEGQTVFYECNKCGHKFSVNT